MAREAARGPAGGRRLHGLGAVSAVLLARHFRKAVVDGFDLSADALEVAAINVRKHRLTGRVRLVESDLMDEAPAGLYDVILSNPPYEPSRHVDRLPAEFRKEPRMALDGGEDGLVLVRRLVRQAKRLLGPSGILMIEVGGCREAFEREFSHLRPHWFYTEDGSDCVCHPHPGAERSQGRPQGRHAKS